MNSYKPPFTMTDEIVNLVAEISELLGRISMQGKMQINPRLRRENRIKTIHSSLAIEHNSLSIEQVTAILNGKRVLGNPNEIKEVQNAYQAYEMMLKLDPLSIKDLLKAHQMMMGDLIKESGRFRSGGVSVFDGQKRIHMASPAKFVPEQIEDLLKWYKTSKIHPLIKSAVFHYEFEFVHPFEDGNGRMGRMWHSLLLGNWNEVFFWLPIEGLIRSRQQQYYDALAQSDKKSDSASFVTLMLEIIKDTLAEIQLFDLPIDQDSDQDSDQDDPVRKMLEAIGGETLSAFEIMERLGLSHKPTFRKNYLQPALEKGNIERTIPDKPSSKHQKYRRKM